MIRNIRPIRIEGNIAYVPLTKGYEAVIDADDAPIVDAFNWCADVRDHTVYALRRSGRKTIRLHRAIMGDPDNIEVDHRDGDGLNNRRVNLREATKSQNQQSKGVYKNNSSGVKNVSWNKQKNKWEVQIRKDGKRIFHAFFKDLLAAKFCAEAEKKKAHGDWAGF